MLIKLIPILVVIILGYVLTKLKFLDDTMASNLKKLVVNVTLPVGLFSSFIKIRFELKYVLVFISVYITCFILMSIGKLIAKAFKIKNRYFPFMLTGFEAGMIGYALFTTAYGQNMYGTFGIVDIGQVSFVFTMVVPAILAMDGAAHNERKALTSLKTAAKSPVVWAIVLGLTLSILGIWRFEDTTAYESVSSVFTLISAPTSFLICLVIGNGLKLSFKGMKAELLTNIIRFTLTLVFATVINILVFKQIGMEPIYTKALYTMFILPAPFVIPAFMDNPSEEDKSYVANTLSIGTLMSLIMFIIITTLF